MRKKTDAEFKRCRLSEDADYLESVQELKFRLSINALDPSPGHHLVSLYSRKLICGTGVGMNFHSYQFNFSNYDLIYFSLIQNIQNIKHFVIPGLYSM